MNITFLIGNGFDRNLGLKTAYSEFVETYKMLPARTENLKKLRENISDNEELWSFAEEALGLYTSQFGEGEAEDFAECHRDICIELARYLKAQQNRIDFNLHIEAIRNAFSRINRIMEPFPTQERIALNDIWEKRKAEGKVFKFICYNYTDTLDRCIKIIENDTAVLGMRKYGSQTIKNRIVPACHVHGTVEKEMVFGVNDETQIKNPEIFKCANGDLYKDLLIKQSANASYRENTDSKAAQILYDSHIIYIYGMSIGATDRLWWERICNWLDGSSDRHLIVQKHGMPAKEVLPVGYQIAEREYKHQITQYGNYNETKRKSVESRIHITDDNIFEAIAGIATVGEDDIRCKSDEKILKQVEEALARV